MMEGNSYLKEKQRKNRRKKKQASAFLGFTISLYLLLFTFSVILSYTERVNADVKRGEVQVYVDSVRVKDGDSLWSIAQSYHSEFYPTTMEYVYAIKECNGLSGDLIVPGMNIMVPYTVRK